MARDTQRLRTTEEVLLDHLDLSKTTPSWI
jgi:hypothetical protein